MKYQIMINILFLLLGRKRVSAKFIADRYDISIRSVYRYVDELSLADIPIYSEKGRNGGFSIMDNFKIPANYFTESEISVINDALSSVESETGDKQIKEILLKLSSLAEKRDEGESISLGNVIIDAGSWTNTESSKTTLRIISECIENTKKIFISYADREGNVSERTIEPHTLILKQGLWYVYSYCNLRKDFRFFRVGRIFAIKVLNETFERKPIDKNDIIMRDWLETEGNIDVDFSLSESIKSEVEEWLGVRRVMVSPSGEIFASARLPFDKGLVAKIISFGSNIKVLAPKKLISEVKSAVENIKNLYE